MPQSKIQDLYRYSRYIIHTNGSHKILLFFCSCRLFLLFMTFCLRFSGAMISKIPDCHLRTFYVKSTLHHVASTHLHLGSEYQVTNFILNTAISTMLPHTKLNNSVSPQKSKPICTVIKLIEFISTADGNNNFNVNDLCSFATLLKQ